MDITRLPRTARARQGCHFMEKLGNNMPGSIDVSQGKLQILKNVDFLKKKLLFTLNILCKIRENCMPVTMGSL